MQAVKEQLLYKAEGTVKSFYYSRKTGEIAALIERKVKEPDPASKKQFIVYFKGKEYGPFDSVSDLGFSPDGQTPVFQAKIDDEWFHITAVNDTHPDKTELIKSELQKPYVGTTESLKDKPLGWFKGISFSPDGRKMAYRAAIGSNVYVMVQKGKTGPFDEVTNVSFSADGCQLSVVGCIDNEIWEKVVSVNQQ